MNPTTAPSSFSFNTNTPSSFSFNANAPSSFSFGASAPSSFGSAALNPLTAQPFSFSKQTASPFAYTPASNAFGAPGASTEPTTNISLETLFENLPEQAKQNVQSFHAFLKEQNQLESFVKTVSEEDLIRFQMHMKDLKQLVQRRQYAQTKQALAVHRMEKELKHLVHHVDHASLMMMSNLESETSSLPLARIARHVESPSPFYWELLENFEQRMQNLKQQIMELQTSLSPLTETQASSNEEARELTCRSLQHLLLQQNSTLMKAATIVAEAHEKADRLRNEFLEKMKQDLIKRGDVAGAASLKNPFGQSQKRSQLKDQKRQTIDNIRFRTSVAPTLLTAPTAQASATNALAPAFGFGSTQPSTSFPATANTKHVTFNLGNASTTAPSLGSTFSFSSSTAAPTTNIASASTLASNGAFTSSLFTNTNEKKGSKRTARSKSRR